MTQPPITVKGVIVGSDPEQTATVTFFFDEPTPPPVAFEAGIVSGSDLAGDARVAVTVDAKLIRAEYSIGQSAEALRPMVEAYSSFDARMLPLAGFSGYIPTVEQARNVATWAKAHPSIKQIEFGNETSYSYQYAQSSPWWNSPELKARARDYALRFRDAHEALLGTGCGLLCQGDDGGSGNTVWLDSMLTAVPDLLDRAAGWTIHPYGPRTKWEPRIDRMLTRIGTAPIWITEYGIASDWGRTLSDNYGWSPNLTYTQAGTALSDTVAQMRLKYGKQLRAFLVYQTRDLRPPGASPNREYYFGAVRQDYSAKNGYTAVVKSLMSST